MTTNAVIVRNLGYVDYFTVWHAMQKFTNERDENTLDEFWLVEHPPVFTQGQNGKAEHILDAGDIPVIPVDRGGQVTYHGPGQLVIYTLVDIKRKKMNIRQIVSHLEHSIIEFLAEYQIFATSQCKAPGVYIESKKICSIGLRIRRGRAFHGIAFNVNMNLEPFSRINPCGYSGLQMTQLTEFYPKESINTVSAKLVKYLITNLGYNDAYFENSA